MNFRRSAKRVVSCIALVFPLFTALNIEAAGFKPYEVKAVYLFRIANFIQWNDENLMDKVHFCVLGNQKINDALVSITNQKTLRSLPIQVYQTLTPQCNITYLSDVNGQLNEQIYSPNMVTISDDDDFTQMGGVIELMHVDNKLKPKINLTNAKKGNYIIGSNLLRISVVEGK
ncbi:conserved exported hypothetical protein [Vibrio chagasii]|nr:conserved exported hypothetical protein [Vibrio chagasii]CAH6919643.1 conserved exported hypothetical protein [Vibrio chagasii]CAH6926590.1 conserved exported hypothetical protein [Vibrio chagasii]